MTEAPTLYADVNAVLTEFRAQIAAILASQFIGLYLYGSLALCDFDPNSSDIDILVVTDGEIAENRFPALKDMHAAFEASDSLWAKHIEAAYIPKQALDPSTPTSILYPQFEHDTGMLIHMPREIGWAFQAYTLRECGVVVAGPDPRTLLDPVDPAALRRAALVIAGGWLEQAGSDPSWVEWLQERGAQSFVVLTLCRFLYMLDQGKLASKPAAGRWAQTALAERYARLVERSLAGQHDPSATAADLDDALALLHYAVDRLQASLSSAE